MKWYEGSLENACGPRAVDIGFCAAPRIMQYTVEPASRQRLFGRGCKARSFGRAIDFDDAHAYAFHLHVGRKIALAIFSSKIKQRSGAAAKPRGDQASEILFIAGG